MSIVFRKIFAILVVAGLLGTSIGVAQTGPKIIPRDRSSPSVHEGLSGTKSAGFKQNIDAFIGQTPVINYNPFHLPFLPAYGSLVTPYGVSAPSPANPSAYGFKPLAQRVFPYLYSETGRLNRLFPGFKGIGGKNVTDVGLPGIVGGTGPGDLYWVGYPRPGNVENPPPIQLLHDPYDCYCRWNQQIRCPLPGPFANEFFFGPLAPVGIFEFTACQACFAGRIVKHDYYVGLEQDGRTFTGYPIDDPSFSGYQQCLRESTESYAASGPGGSPGNFNYGL